MSKSLGNVTCPHELIAKYGICSVRTYFLAEGPQTKDCNFMEQRLLETNNAFMSDQYVNLLQRTTGKKILKVLREHKPALKLSMPFKADDSAELVSRVEKLASEAVA